MADHHDGMEVCHTIDPVGTTFYLRGDFTPTKENVRDAQIVSTYGTEESAKQAVDEIAKSTRDNRFVITSQEHGGKAVAKLAHAYISRNGNLGGVVVIDDPEASQYYQRLVQENRRQGKPALGFSLGVDHFGPIDKETKLPLALDEHLIQHLAIVKDPAHARWQTYAEHVTTDPHDFYDNLRTAQQRGDIKYMANRDKDALVSYSFARRPGSKVRASRGSGTGRTSRMAFYTLHGQDEANVDHAAALENSGLGQQMLEDDVIDALPLGEPSAAVHHNKSPPGDNNIFTTNTALTTVSTGDPGLTTTMADAPIGGSNGAAAQGQQQQQQPQQVKNAEVQQLRDTEKSTSMAGTHPMEPAAKRYAVAGSGASGTAPVPQEKSATRAAAEDNVSDAARAALEANRLANRAAANNAAAAAAAAAAGKQSAGGQQQQQQQTDPNAMQVDTDATKQQPTADEITKNAEADLTRQIEEKRKIQLDKMQEAKAQLEKQPDGPVEVVGADLKAMFGAVLDMQQKVSDLTQYKQLQEEKEKMQATKAKTEADQLRWNTLMTSLEKTNNPTVKSQVGMWEKMRKSGVAQEILESSIADWQKSHFETPAVATTASAGDAMDQDGSLDEYMDGLQSDVNQFKQQQHQQQSINGAQTRSERMLIDRQLNDPAYRARVEEAESQAAMRRIQSGVKSNITRINAVPMDQYDSYDSMAVDNDADAMDVDDGYRQQPQQSGGGVRRKQVSFGDETDDGGLFQGSSAEETEAMHQRGLAAQQQYANAGIDDYAFDHDEVRSASAATATNRSNVFLSEDVVNARKQQQQQQQQRSPAMQTVASAGGVSHCALRPTRQKFDVSDFVTFYLPGTDIAFDHKAFAVEVEKAVQRDLAQHQVNVKRQAAMRTVASRSGGMPSNGAHAPWSNVPIEQIRQASRERNRDRIMRETTGFSWQDVMRGDLVDGDLLHTQRGAPLNMKNLNASLPQWAAEVREKHEVSTDNHPATDDIAELRDKTPEEQIAMKKIMWGGDPNSAQYRPTSKSAVPFSNTMVQKWDGTPMYDMKSRASTGAYWADRPGDPQFMMARDAVNSIFGNSTSSYAY